MFALETAIAFDVPVPFLPEPVQDGVRARPTIVVIDDDPLFCRLIQRKADALHIPIVCFHPDRDFSELPEDGEFDVAIIDYNLGELRGTQLSALYCDTPVLLISGSKDPQMEEDLWPRSVRRFLTKHRGVEAILAAALQLGRDHQASI